MGPTSASATLWTTLAGQRATWAAESALAAPIELLWDLSRGTPIAITPALPGWRPFMWAIDDGQLWLRRPEGAWKCRINEPPKSFCICESDSRYLAGHRGFLMIDSRSTGRAWRTPAGRPCDLAEVDKTYAPPTELAGVAHFVGALQGLSGSETARVVELDDFFDRGPLSVERAGRWLLVSSHQLTVAYALSAESRVWEAIAADRCRLAIGSDDPFGWLPRQIIDPAAVALLDSDRSV